MGNRRKPRNPAIAWTSTGAQQEATPHRQRVGFDRHLALYEQALANRTHMWHVLVQHTASPRFLDAVDGNQLDGPGLLDVDTLLGPPMVGCFVCEQSYSPQLRRTRCPGEPPATNSIKEGTRR